MTFLVRWVDAALMAAVNSMIILDTHDCLALTEQENFRKRQEKHLGGTLESLQGQRGSVLPKFQIALHPARSILKESEYLGGARPGCGDVVLHAVFKWCTQVSRFQLLREDDSLHAWARRMDKLLGLG
jgi:hypothetical protein